jgi:hypothetical protein
MTAAGKLLCIYEFIIFIVARGIKKIKNGMKHLAELA